MTLGWSKIKNCAADFMKGKDNDPDNDIFNSKADGFKLSSLNKWLLFSVFLGLMVIDRIITLIHFGFVYTDVDQLMLWNGAIDYSKGIFHEPFFYGQNYNYMLEALCAVPLLWIHIPVYIALPLTTSIISLLPFMVLALFFLKREYYFWAFLCLAFPVILPLPYNFLTTISRGAVQAHLFVPFLFIPLFNPRSKKNVTILFLVSSICVVANQSSLLIVVPIVLFVYSYHFKSFPFYLKSLWMIPFFIADYFAKHFYVIHPENTLRVLGGLKPDIHTFLASIKNTDIFEYLFPFFSGWGIVYPFLFVLMAILAFKKSGKKELLFILSIIILLLITFAFPKVQESYPYPNAGIFFSASRFYLYLPVLLIITLYIIFHKFIRKMYSVYILLLLCGIMFFSKYHNIQKTVEQTNSRTSFPVAKNLDLITRANELKLISEKYHIDLVVFLHSSGWNYFFDNYAFYPLTSTDNQNNINTISVSVDGDRRSWLYPISEHCKQILLNGIEIDESLLKVFDYEVISPDQIIIKNNKLNVSKLFAKLNIKFGNTIFY